MSPVSPLTVEQGPTHYWPGAPMPAMPMASFQAWRRQVVARLPQVLDGAMNAPFSILPSRYPDRFPPVEPTLAHPTPAAVARAFAKVLGQEGEGDGALLLSRGVRDSLGIIFRQLKQERPAPRLWLPGQGWPVYQALAAEAGLEVASAPPDQPVAWESLEASEGWVVLVCDPPRLPLDRMKEEDWERLGDLARVRGGRILIDSAHDFTIRKATGRLVEEGLAAWLGTLSTQWLLPYLAGVVVAGANMIRPWKGPFGRARPPASSLAIAHQVLIRQPHRRERVEDLLSQARQAMTHALEERGVRARDPGRGYLLSTPLAPQVLLDKGVLAIPLSAYGASGQGSLVSALSLA